MRRVAAEIEILDEIKTETNTEEGYSYTFEFREVLVKDSEGVVLEIFKTPIEITTEEEFSNISGVVLGISTWIDID
jgi:hypothetical protein